MKKVISILMVLTMLLGSASAFADEYKHGAVHGVEFSLGRTLEANDTAKLELEKANAEKLLADTGNTLNYVDFTYDYTAIGAMFEGGQIPNVFQVANSEPQKLIANGWGRDITECIKAAGLDLNAFNPGLLSIYTAPDGGIWGLPKFAYTMGIVTNAKLFREAGLVNEDGSYMIPKTWDEIIEFGEIIYEKTGKGGYATTAIDGYGGWYFTALALAFGADLCQRNADGTYTANLTSPEAIEAMSFFQKLFKSKAIYGDPTIDSQDDVQAYLSAGNVAMYISSYENIQDLTNINKFGMDPADVMLIPMPVPAVPENYLLYTGGDGIWFGPNATDDQVIAALDYYANFGLLAGWDEEIEAAYRAELDVKVKTNKMVCLPSFPVFNDESYQKKMDILKNEYMGQIDFEKQFGAYYDVVNTAKASYEEDGDMQNMFRIVVSVIQELFVNPDADLEALMKDANDQYQSLLDSMN